LDYHKTFKEYKRVKMSFVNSAKIKIISKKTAKLNILGGEYNNINAETAIRVVEELSRRAGSGFAREALKTLKTFVLPDGRLQEIKNKNGYRIFVDFAHTPDSLEAVLKYLRTLVGKNGKLISVFGCASERDVKKRRKMGKISGQMADVSVFTTEDSRFENINHIFYKMKLDNKNATCIPERGEAIAYALSIAKTGDVVGFFGKGHEKSMAYFGIEHPWSEKSAINDYLEKDNSVSAIILAAGKGTRMKSRKPKVIHEICGRPMVTYTLANLRKAKVADITAVVSFRKNLVINKIKGAVKFGFQKNPKGGTADAVRSGLPLVNPKAKNVLVINGDDSAFYTPQTIRKIIDIHNLRERKLTFVSLIKEDPTGLGRVVRGKNGLITKIVEEKDASPSEIKIKEVNDGLYLFDHKWLSKNLNKVKKGQQGEYYLTDLVKMCIDGGEKMATYTMPNDDEWHGINTPEQLQSAEEKMRIKLSENV
jgi:dTDP-glucose pyrophosphorylase